MPIWKESAAAPVAIAMATGKQVSKNGEPLPESQKEREAQYSFPNKQGKDKDGKDKKKYSKHQDGSGVLPSISEIHHDAEKSGAPGFDVAPEKNYGLMDLIDIAQSSNPQTKEAWNMAKNAALTMGIAKASYLPTITGSVIGGYWENHWDAKYNTSVNLPGTQGGTIGGHNIPGLPPQTIGADAKGNTHIGGDLQSEVATMTWLLFDYGRDATVRATHHMALAANISFTGVHQRVIYHVAETYYLYNAAKKRLVLAKASLENTTHVNEAVQARLKYGQATAVDSAQSQAAVATADLEVVKAEGAVSDAYLALVNAMGINPQTQVGIEPAPEGELNPHDFHMTDEIVNGAVARRPDVLAALSRYKASKEGIQAAIGDFAPKIFASGYASYQTFGLGLSLTDQGGSGINSHTGIDAQNFDGAIFGGITMPIFDGGMRLARLKEAKNNAKNAEESLRDIENAAIKEIISAHNGLKTGLSTWTASKRMDEAATLGFNAGLEAYRSGEGSVTRLLELQNQLYKAETGKWDAYYASLVSAASLAFATGSLGSGKDVQDNQFSPVGFKAH
ncbi:transporter [Lasius niger]|uniref:Transporter n=1 Tax=Lasius niger TaxID=67767 RepID=A0A0J7KQG8_LASNI|nr:transporter [Lasius niger]